MSINRVKGFLKKLDKDPITELCNHMHWAEIYYDAKIMLVMCCNCGHLREIQRSL